MPPELHDHHVFYIILFGAFCIGTFPYVVRFDLFYSIPTPAAYHNCFV